ncbi:MAG: xanthine dehydrogenase family protein molybdopterin-binding subunit, partial [Sphingomonadaceae bacterium]
TGRGQYTDDLALPGMAHAVTVRSPYGHARIRSIDTAEALAVPGVLAVITHADIADLAPMPTLVPFARDATPRLVLAGGGVRFLVALFSFVVAETRAPAPAAAELVAVDYEELPAVGTIEEALAPGAPAVWPDNPTNILFDFPLGDADAVRAALAASSHVTRLRVVQNRVAPTSLEVRAALGHVDPDHGLTLHAGTQGVAEARDVIATILRRPADSIRLVTKDVGGGFGMKMFTYPEYVLVLVAAERLGRPVKWAGTRSDAFQTDTHGRDMVSEAALGFDAQGRITALSVETWSNLGAYQGEFGPAVQALAGGRIMGGVYRIPAIHNLIHGVVTNTAPVDAYR